MMLPEPCSIMLRPISRQQRNIPLRFTSIISLQASAVSWSDGVMPPIPALFTRMSQRP